MNKTLFEVIKEHSEDLDDCYINNVEIAIRSWIDKRLPSPKQGITFNNYSSDNVNHFSPTDNQKVGYNQALSDVRKSLLGTQGEK